MKSTATSPHTAPQPARYKQVIAALGRYLGSVAARLPDSFWAGGAITIAGLATLLLLCWAIGRWIVSLVNPSWLFLPLVALVGYRWGWRLGLIATAGELVLVWYFFTPPRFWQGSPTADGIARPFSLTIGTLFILALVDLAAHKQRDATRLAEANATLFRQEAERRTHLEALHHIGAALTSELDKERLLQLIAGTARDLTGAGFAAFTLCLEQGDDERFHLAGSAGLTPQQEMIFRTMPLGGEGMLAPIYKEHRLVRVNNTTNDPHAVGQPRGHMLVRSFLGAPLLGQDGRMLGGHLLGHTHPSQFTAEHETLLKGLAAQAAVAIENARLYEQARARAEELEAVIESMVDGVALHNAREDLMRQNPAALLMAETMSTPIATLLMQDVPGIQLCTPDHQPLSLEARPSQRALAGDVIRSQDLQVVWETGAER